MATGRRRRTRTIKHRDMYGALAIATASFALVFALDEPSTAPSLPILTEEQQASRTQPYQVLEEDGICQWVTDNETAPVQYSWC